MDVTREISERIMSKVADILDIDALANEVAAKLKPQLADKVVEQALKWIENDLDIAYLMEEVLNDEKLNEAIVKMLTKGIKSGLKA